jgi:tagatose-6-phosphate ketose/aldose isomerase
MSYLEIPLAQLADQGALWTAREIAQQPQVWPAVSARVEQQRSRIDAFFEPLRAHTNLRIMLTGAGSSAFIGECLAPAMMRRLNRRVEAVPTTDLVSGPQGCFQRDVPTLLVSFARSGSSPESVAAVDLAEQSVAQCHHVVFTCNKDGELYQRCAAMPNALTLLMPDETHDRGFAMTSSFTSLLLAAARVFGLIDEPVARVALLAAAAGELMRRGTAPLQQMADRCFERVVYLGSNELQGVAREAALKLLELTDGRTIGSFDSSLGFRHGPKTIVNAQTLIVFFLSNDPYTRRYDLDLLHEVRRDDTAGQVLALSAQPTDLEGTITLDHLAGANDLDLVLPFAVFAQLFAFFQSLRLGITPDNPSVNGAVNRVVHGVTIYPWAREDGHVPGR